MKEGGEVGREIDGLMFARMTDKWTDGVGGDPRLCAL